MFFRNTIKKNNPNKGFRLSPIFFNSLNVFISKFRASVLDEFCPFYLNADLTCSHPAKKVLSLLSYFLSVLEEREAHLKNNLCRKSLLCLGENFPRLYKNMHKKIWEHKNGFYQENATQIQSLCIQANLENKCLRNHFNRLNLLFNVELAIFNYYKKTDNFFNRFFKLRYYSSHRQNDIHQILKLFTFPQLAEEAMIDLEDYLKQLQCGPLGQSLLANLLNQAMQAFKKTSFQKHAS